MTREVEMGLEERVRRLEAGVERHARELERLRSRPTLPEEVVFDRPEQAPEVREITLKDAAAVSGLDVPEKAVPERSGETAETGRSSGGVWQDLGLPFEVANLRRWEWWLNKVGIALFLMGVVFLFKFSWDRGWLQVLLTPVVRVGLGIVLGSALAWVGLRVYAARRAFAQVVLGGGIGTYYITGFAAFQMLGVFSYPVAFAFMAAVTLLAFALALRQDGAALAVVGVSGGFATPFLLYQGEGALGGLVLYAGLVLAGAIGMYLYKGWSSLLAVSFGGYWAVLLTGHAGTALDGAPRLADGVALQAGVLLGWLSLWLVPAAREALRSADPARWRVPDPGIPLRGLLGGDVPFRSDATPARLLSLASPPVALWMTAHVWDPGRTTLGLVALSIAAAHGLGWVVFRRVAGGGCVSYAQAIVALVFATLALVFLLEGRTLLLALAVEAAGLRFVAGRLPDRVVGAISHALFAGVGAWTLSDLAVGALENAFYPSPATPFLNMSALVSVAVVALAFASSAAIAASETRRAYRTLGHGAVALLILSELAPFVGGAYALAALALYAAGLHLLSRRRPAWGTTGGAHALAGFVGLWLASRFALHLPFPDGFGRSLLGPWGLWGLADLVAVTAILASSFFVAGRKTVLAYRVAAHVGLLAWLWRELGALPGSADAYVTLAWGICGAAMFVAGLRRDHAHLIKGGVATLFLVVAKLFLWDLAGLEPVWRVLLFLGFGGLFLLLSYHLRNLWNPGDGGENPDTPEHRGEPSGHRL